MRPLSLAERIEGDASVSLRELLSSNREAPAGRTDYRLEAYVSEILRKRETSQGLSYQMDTSYAPKRTAVAHPFGRAQRIFS